MNQEVVTEIRAMVGEGPSWDSKNRVLYWVDIPNGFIYVHHPDTRRDDPIHVGGWVSSVVPRKNGGMVATFQHGFFSVDSEGKTSLISSEVESGIEGNRFNEGKCDPAGRYWAGTMDIKEKDPTGSLYFLENSKVEKVLPDIYVSNGLGWSPDNKTMYYIDSTPAKVYAFDYSLETGEIKNKRTIVDFVKLGQPGVPDGMAVDAEGMIWVAHWGGSRVTRWDPNSSKLLQTLSFPVPNTSSCCFGGEDLDELYVTTAREGLDHDALAKQPLSGALFVVKLDGIKGLPTFSFNG